MNIHDINAGARRPDALRARAADVAQTPPPATGEAAEAKAAPADRLELSHEARAAETQSNDLKREIEFARRAMYSMPPLSPERAEEILDRLEQGHYNAPDVRMKLSDMLTKNLGFEAGGPAEQA